MYFYTDPTGRESILVYFVFTQLRGLWYGSVSRGSVRCPTNVYVFI